MSLDKTTEMQVDNSCNCYGLFTLPDTETETDKNGFYRILWGCSYCSETETKAISNWFCTYFIGYNIGVGVGQCEQTIRPISATTTAHIRPCFCVHCLNLREDLFREFAQFYRFVYSIRNIHIKQTQLKDQLN